MGVFRVEKNKNYTVISNYHLRDKNLSLRTIGLLSLILSLPDNWDYSQAGLVAICKDGEDSVRSGLKELEKCGYLKRERERDSSGRVRGIIYHIYEVPNKESPKQDFPTLVKPKLDVPKSANQKTANPTLENCTQINKDEINTNARNTKQSNINHCQSEWDRRKDMDRMIRENIGYEFFKFKVDNINDKLEQGSISLDEYDEQSLTYNLKTVNQVISYMLDLLTSLNNDPILIGEDLIDRAVVKDKLLTIGLSEMKQVVYVLNTIDIKNPKKYAISMLYNL